MGTYLCTQMQFFSFLTMNPCCQLLYFTLFVQKNQHWDKPAFWERLSTPTRSDLLLQLLPGLLLLFKRHFLLDETTQSITLNVKGCVRVKAVPMSENPRSRRCSISHPTRNEKMPEVWSFLLPSPTFILFLWQNLKQSQSKSAFHLVGGGGSDSGFANMTLLEPQDERSHRIPEKQSCLRRCVTSFTLGILAEVGSWWHRCRFSEVHEWNRQSSKRF